IPYPVPATAGDPGNAYFNDVVRVVDAAGKPTGRGIIPFPPLPALVLLPLVALVGLAVDQTSLAILIGALDVGLAFWVLGRLRVRRAVRIALTVFVGAGTGVWYAASLGSTWHFAHVIAVGLGLAAVGLALDGQAAAGRRGTAGPTAAVDARQVTAGLLLGLAATSRLTVLFGLPFFFLVGGGGSWARRGLAASLGAAIPILALVGYTWLATGEPFNPAYEALYRYEIEAYPEMGYNADWALQDLRYVPQNLALMLGGLPQVMPPCAPGVPREPFSLEGCSWIVPDRRGMSLLLASPAWLLVLPALRLLRDPRVVGAFLAAGAIALVNLMHFSQGWVQFGYRFSLDFLPFLLVALALGTDRFLGPREGSRRGRALVVGGLVAVSVAIQVWGVAWARTLGW
ncbi:MAG: hypothetical protein MUC54_06220, partial [Chloroflexi bacterium]|nr:hypothetical protein [Chloroflexota bacterium]